MNEEKCLLENLPDLNYFDLYQHLKFNLKEFQHNCKDKVDNKTNLGYYCLNCKLSYCNICDSHEHSEHSSVEKHLYEMESDVVENVFRKVNCELEANVIIQNPKELKNRMIQNITEQIDVLHEKLEKFKEKNIEEIDSIFESISSIGGNLRLNLNQTKNDIENFFNKHRKFFNCDKYNNDRENTIFLLNFELLNNCHKKNDYLVNTMSKLESSANALEDILTGKFEEISKILELSSKSNEDYVLEITKNDISKGVATLDQDHYEGIKKRLIKYDEHIETFKGLAFFNISESGNLSDIERIIELYDKKNRTEANIGIEELDQNKNSKDYSSQKDISAFNEGENYQSELTDCKFKENIKNGENDISEEIKDQFSSNKTVSPLRENKKHVSSSKNNYASTPIRKAGKNNTSKTETSQKEKLNLADFNIIINFKNKSDVILQNRILHRYFAYNTLDFINREFRIREGIMKSGVSFAYLPTVVTGIEDEYDSDVCKPIIGTNEIQIYDRKKRILVKKKVQLDKQSHGYTTFLDGVRHLLVNDKLYITGGKDEIQDYKVVLLFDTRDFTLKRLGDMLRARSYHTIQFNELFKTILVVGGHNNSTCEILDMKMNRWRSLPPLNYPRANVSIYFDNIENNLYSFFGIEGEISKSGDFSEVVEVLKFKNIKLGWVRVDYNNKSDLLFKKFYSQIFPLTNDKILIYGGKNLRNTSKKYFSIFMMSRNEIVKVDNKILDYLRVRAKKSPRLSQILSAFS